jgi:hypothetical protein
VRPWQAADMRRLDMIGILLDGHRCFLRVRHCRPCGIHGCPEFGCLVPSVFVRLLPSPKPAT